MSLVIKKFAEGGSSEVRTYKRGNDEVDLNAFIRLAEAGFNDWLDRTDIKDKHKKEVRAAYQDMITKINDNPESFTSRLGGGFTNTFGITNKTKGFDAYGIAAGYLGNTLRNMSVYTKPEVKSDKAKYNKDAGLVTSTMQLQMWGNSPESFIRLDDDSYDESTGSRGVTNRVALTIASLGALKGRLRDYYDFDSDEDYNHAVGRIDSTIAQLLDANANNDWFALTQLGVTNLDDYFATSKRPPTTPLTQEEQSLAQSQQLAREFEEYRTSKYPVWTGTLHSAISLSGANDLPVSSATLTEFRNKFNSFSKEDLKKWMQEYIGNIDDYDVNNNQYMRRIYPNGIPNFSNGQIISTILNKMKDWGMLHRFSSDSTKYYVPGSSILGAGYVWDTETNTLHHMEIDDIPFWHDQIAKGFRTSRGGGSYTGNSQYQQKYPEFYKKNGGVLKANLGLQFPEVPEIEIPDPFADWNRQQNLLLYNSMVSPGWARLNYGTNPENLDDDGNARVWGAYDILPGWEGAGHDMRTEAIGKTPLTPTIANAYRMLRRYIDSGNMLQDVRTAYQNWILSNPDKSYLDFVNYYNSKVDNIRRLGVTRFLNGQNARGYLDLFDDFNELYSSNRDIALDNGLLGALDNIGDILGSTNFSRNALAFNSDEDSSDLRLGTFIDDDPTKTQFWINNEGKLELRTPESLAQLENSSTNPLAVEGELAGELLNDEDQRLATLLELQAKLKSLGTSASLSKLGFWGDLGIDLLGASRLAGSIHANNRIARTIRDSLRPKLHDTYELYSPVTGAFSEMLLRNRLGADILSLSNRPFTSDASLAAARMLEGQRQATDLQYLGFLADDKEIKRTQAEALLRQEGNIARRSALANENRDAIIANNQAVAQLEASRIKQNWNSIDNYLLSIESRMRNRLTESRDRQHLFALQTSSTSADLWRRAAMDSLRDKYETWKAGDSSRKDLTFTDWATLNHEAYSRAIQDINATTEALKYRGYASTYGLKYNWPTYKDENGVELPLGFDINSGRYKWLKLGGPIKPSSDYLINKIIRENESNS